MAQRRPGGLRPALPIPRVRLLAGDEQRGWLVTQKFVILVPDPIGFAPWTVLLDPGEPCDICQQDTPPLAERARRLQCRASLAVLPNGGCRWSECELLPSLWRCVSFCATSYHKSIGGRSAARASHWQTTTAATARTRPPVLRNQRHQWQKRLPLLQREQP